MSAKLTRNQALVLGALNRDGGPMSAYALLDALREEGFRAPLQVYRALDRLVEAGHVHRIESRNAFIACRDHDHAHGEDTGEAAPIVFMLCDRCGTAEEAVDPAVGDRLAEMAAAAGFVARHRMVELRGHCAKCHVAADG